MKEVGRGGREEKREGAKKSKYKTIKRDCFKMSTFFFKDLYSLLADVLECNSYYLLKMVLLFAMTFLTYFC